ncbi:hypothetical protein EYC84_006507 [Monilinia fructicola]|uniref:Uncharacterized protein n=1 Tax=Monilinia fructicola TaxID=38448 RepID=A0A5M9K834_MONFR|nr:hypothetical protein EYC84_006507 [Monilinia fructicola]
MVFLQSQAVCPTKPQLCDGHVKPQSIPFKPSLIFTTLSKSNLAINDDTRSVDLHDFQSSHLVWQGISIFLSRRPARRSAGSRVSGRLVAMIIFVFPNNRNHKLIQ